jgi:hypothetical protein
VTTKDIRTSDAYTSCDVCGRTLLRGERSEVYLNGGARREVCELCKDRAIHEGWVREGTVPAYAEGDGGSDRRRSLFARFRSRRELGAATPNPTLADGLDSQSWSQERPSAQPPPVPAAPTPQRRRSAGRPSGPREPRHVHAVPTSIEQKAASAIGAFNISEHPRTVAGVARSLGLPEVAVAPDEVHPGIVLIVVSWELCWYRYEVDLAAERPSVRVAGQGYELDELTADEQQPNAIADENGVLSLG